MWYVGAHTAWLVVYFEKEKYDAWFGYCFVTYAAAAQHLQQLQHAAMHASVNGSIAAICCLLCAVCVTEWSMYGRNWR
jgi:hypothetical protein